MLSLPKLDEKIPGSKYFTWAEALWLNTLQAYAVPTEAQKLGIIRQAQALDKLREHFGQPLNVTSWLRPQKYNALIGGAPRSKHMEGIATDFTVEGLTVESVKSTIQKLGTKLYPGRGEINTTTWVHLDLTPGPWFKG